MRCTLEMRQCIAVVQTPPPSPATAHIEALVGSKKSPTTRQSPARHGPYPLHPVELALSLSLACWLRAPVGDVCFHATRRDADSALRHDVMRRRHLHVVSVIDARLIPLSASHADHAPNSRSVRTYLYSITTLLSRVIGRNC